MTVLEAGFFDRKRSVPLPAGRPKFPNWTALLAIGPVIVTGGEYPFIENAHADGYTFPLEARRPALFDGALVDRWLDSEEGAACSALRHAWGSRLSPECKFQARAMLEHWNDCDCMEIYGRHRLGRAKASRPTLAYEPVDCGEWAVACCRDCLRPFLWYFPTIDETPSKSWPFFDMRWEPASSK
ncbi:hypothetical protein [Spelaeicoccus albus]|uniref:Uncharacterized protein n=1 Tax=Spelaeicoccus albus TaxID=1280376 RepID=A0A7Z0A9S2_9MICO|nr:hypothetical protein [Spelaeicoccus albus]NYI66211.1 hypothetical protein [Spelaeicoccus albus]